MFNENFVPLSLTDFFLVSCNCHYISKNAPEKSIKENRYLIPHTHRLSQEEPFADLYMGWNEEGLHFFCEAKTVFKDVFYPEVTRGDSLELFIDTRDIKTSGFNTKFCHHFVFLPQEVQGIKSAEMTRFRGEEARELCSSKDLHVHSEIYKNRYTLKIFIPSQCLYGYDPEQCARLGFTYRVNRCGAGAQHFLPITEEFAFEQQPSTWSSFSLINGDENSTIPSPSGKRGKIH